MVHVKNELPVERAEKLNRVDLILIDDVSRHVMNDADVGRWLRYRFQVTEKVLLLPVIRDPSG